MRTRRVCTNICMMAHQHAVCGAAPTEPLRRVNLRSEPFGPLQFRLISKIYEFGSRQITHPLISPVGLSQPRGGGGGGRRGGGDWRTQLSANHTPPPPPTCWLKAASFFQLLDSLFPLRRVHLTPSSRGKNIYQRVLGSEREVERNVNVMV